MIIMKRRDFIATSAAFFATANVSFASPFLAEDIETFKKVLNSFDSDMRLLRGNRGTWHLYENKRTTWFLTYNQDDLVKKFVSVESDYINYDREYDPLDIYSKFKPEEFLCRKTAIGQVYRAINLIAQKTLRSRANHYAVFSDHILFWYKGRHNLQDTPIKRVGRNIALHPNWNDYFIRVKGFELSDYSKYVLSEIGVTEV